MLTWSNGFSEVYTLPVLLIAHISTRFNAWAGDKRRQLPAESFGKETSLPLKVMESGKGREDLKMRSMRSKYLCGQIILKTRRCWVA